MTNRLLQRLTEEQLNNRYEVEGFWKYGKEEGFWDVMACFTSATDVYNFLKSVRSKTIDMRVVKRFRVLDLESKEFIYEDSEDAAN